MFTFLLEVLGTVAFAAVGATTAIKRRLDIFGILILSVISAIGGGVIRDIVLGIVPPISFQNPLNIALAILSGVLVIVVYHKSKGVFDQPAIVKAIEIFDAIGLAVFTVNGIDTALLNSDHNAFLLCFVGVVTATGGGIMRDIMVGHTPAVLKKEIYATASIVGSILYIILLHFISPSLSRWIVISIIILIRLFSIHNKINLPIVRVP